MVYTSTKTDNEFAQHGKRAGKQAWLWMTDGN